MFGRLLSGGWSDRVNRKTLLLTALGMITAAFVLFCFAHTLPLLFAAKILQGIGSGVISTVLCTVAFDTLPPELLGSGIGVFSLASSLAQCVAPSIGTALAHAGMYRTLFLSAALVAALSFLVLMLIPVPLTPRAIQWAEAKKNGTLKKRGFHISDYLCREAMPAAMLLLMNGVIHAAIMNYLSICGLSRGINSIATFFVINSVVLIASRPLLGKFADHKPLSWLLLPGYALMAASCVLIATAQSMPPVLIAAVCYGLGFGATQCAGQLAAIRSVGLDRRNVANSTYYVGGDVGLTLGAYIDGALAASVGYAVMYNFIAACCLATLAGCVVYGVQKRTQTAKQA